MMLAEDNEKKSIQMVTTPFGHDGMKHEYLWDLLSLSFSG